MPTSAPHRCPSGETTTPAIATEDVRPNDPLAAQLPVPSPSLARRHGSARSRRIHHDQRKQQQQQQCAPQAGPCLERSDHGVMHDDTMLAMTPLSPLLPRRHDDELETAPTNHAQGIPHNALPHLQPPESSPSSSSSHQRQAQVDDTATATPTRKPSKGALLLSIPQSLLRSTLGRSSPSSSSPRSNSPHAGPHDVTLERLQHSHALPTLDRQALQSLGRALSERKPAPPPSPAAAPRASSSPVSPDQVSAHLPDKVVLSKSQLKEIAPTVLRQPEAACERLGVRPVSNVSSAFEVDLGQFVPAMHVLSPAPGEGAPDLTPLEHSAKLDLLYQLLATRSTSGGVIDAATIRSVLTEALGNNALYLAADDLDTLTGVLLAKLDVDGDGAVSAMDFKLATRAWNLAGIGLPAAPSAKANVDIFGLDYLALDVQSKSPHSTKNLDAAGTTLTPRSMKRRSRVRGASRWMLDRTPSQLWEPDALQTPVTPSPVNSTPTSPSTPFAPTPAFAPHLNAPLKPAHPPTPGASSSKTSSPLTNHLRLEGGKLVCVGLFTLGAFAVFTWRLLYLLSVSKLGMAVGWALAIASGTAHVVLLCVAFSFLLMCRRVLTLIRNVRVLEWVPVDKHITWHKYVGWIATMAGIVHTLSHTFGVFPKLAGNQAVRAVAGFPALPPNASTLGEYAKLMLLSIPGSTGWALVVVFGIMAATATNRVRRAKFETFWYTHHLFWAALALLLVHGLQGILGPSWAWKYLGVPAALYYFERLLRVLRTLWPSTILHARIEGDTLSLAFTRPWFARSYSAGQYVFLNIPALSNWQWHPFTLTSAPSDPYLSVRIKRAGDWTGLLFDSLAPFATAALRSSLGPSVSSPTSSAFPKHISAALPKVYVDGPFGASSQDFVNFDRVVFIATGVGATPFLSILRHIEFLVKGQLQDQEGRGSDADDSDDADLDLEAGGAGARAKSRFSITRIDFFWVNRDQEGFKWMSKALRDVDPRVLRLLRVHTFLTSAQGNAELTSYLLWWGLQLAKEGPLGGRCALTGLQHSAQYWGRPSWDQVFEQLGKATPAGDQVGVFFCGPKPLGKELYQLVRKTNVTSPGTLFFAKENF